MKKIYKTNGLIEKLFVFLLSITFVTSLNAQVSAYSFSQSLGTFNLITGGTVIATGTADDNTYGTQNIGFNFDYNSITYTQFGLNVNGWISLGPTAPVSSYTPISTGTTNNIISGLGRDLQLGFTTVGDRTTGSNIITNVTSTVGFLVGDVLTTATGFPAGTTITAIGAGTITVSNNATTTGTAGALTVGGEIRTETIGTAPNRICVVQWLRTRRFGTGVTTGRNTFFNFQILLYETTNQIQVVYGPFSTNPTASTYEIGLRGSSNADFNNRTTTTDWSATTAGAVNSANNTLTTTVFPASGQTYTWTPPLPCSGTPVAGTASGPAAACSGTNFNVSLSGYTTGATGIIFQWQSSPDGVTYSNIAGATNATSAVNQTSTTYYQCIVTCTASGLSSTSNSFQVTMNPFYNCYCTSNATTTADEEILNVTVGSLNNSSTCATTGGPGSVLNQYSDYTTIATAPNLAKSANYTFSIQIGTCGGNFTSGTAIFIDYNQNGLFTDPGEQVFTTPVGTNGPHTVTGNFTVPMAALSGTTRMRVINAEGYAGAGITPCLVYGYGETEDYLVNIVPLPPNPPAPVQDPSIPTCAGGTNLTVPGSPAAGDTWYWQTTAMGTSTANAVSGPYTVFLNGTYYVRTYNAANMIWSAGSDSVVVSNIPLAPLPPSPTATASPACTSTTISIVAPPSGVGYFWQGTTVNGTGTTQNATSPYTVNSSGTYYVSAYDSTSSCWSNTNGVAVQIDTFIPQAPVSSGNVTICAGASSAMIAATVASSGSQTVSFGTNLISTGTVPAVFNATIPALPAGATITGTQLEILGATALGGSYRSEIRVALSGVITLPATQISPLASAGLITPDPVITVANPPIGGGAVTLTLTETFDDAGNDASFNEVRLIINYTLPTTTINWYNASTAGIMQGSGSPFETVGTTLLPNTNTAGTYTFYAEAVSGACASSTRSNVDVIINPLPVMTLNDTAVCTGSTYTLDGQNAGSTYLWNTTETTQTIVVSAGGAYSVDITTALGCTATDNMNLILNSLPIVNLGADVAFCDGDNITLDAGNTGMDFLWNDTAASTTQTITVTTGATYSVLVTNPSTGCSNTDDIIVTVNPNPVQNLGVDSAQCAGTITLDAGSGNYNYMWNDASTSQTLIASATGTYSVMVVDSITGCYQADTINVTISSLPVVDLGVDSVQCGGAIVLDAGNAGSTYLWSDASASQTLSATSTGTYAVTVTDMNSCSASDTIDITINNLPTPNLGADSSSCGGSITLDAGNPGMDYLWNNSSTSQTITVFITGTYSVMVTDLSTGCQAADTVNLTIGSIPVVNIGNDSTQCGGVITLNAQNAGATYLWSTTASTQTITVSTSGTYNVTVTNSDGCSASDTVMLTINPLPGVGLIPFSSPVCNDLTSFILTNGTPSGGVYSGPTVVGNVFNPQAAGVGSHTITYTITDGNGCSNSSSQNIMVNNCIGIIESSNTYFVNVYPNPTQGTFTLAIDNASIDELLISIVDMQGKEVFAVREKNIATEYKQQIDLSDVSKGIYFIKLSTGSDVKVQKLIIQ